MVRGFGDSCSAGRWRRVSTTHKRPASPPLEREPFVCARFSRQQEQRVCAPPSKKRKNTERVCGDPLLPLPVASLPPHSPVPWGVALTNTMAVLPLVPGQATRRCPRQPPMLRNPATPATGFRRVFLLFFLLGGCGKPFPACSALCCSRWCCAAVCVAVPAVVLDFHYYPLISFTGTQTSQADPQENRTRFLASRGRWPSTTGRRRPR